MNRRALLPAVLALVLTLAACGKDPVSPTAGQWSYATLPDLPRGATLLDLAFNGKRGIAVGFVATPGPDDRPVFTPLVLETGDGLTWTRTATDAVGDAVLLGAASTPGGFVAVGGRPGTMGIGTPLILDLRGGTQVVTFPEVSGAFNAVAATHDRVVAVGTADGGLARSSPLGTVAWSEEDLGFSTPQEKGLTDIVASPFTGALFTTGWDDGGPPYGVLKTSNAADVWTDLLSGPGVPGAESQRLAVWEAESGNVYVGGSYEGIDAFEFHARLDFLTPTGWVSLALPDSRTLGSVNAIWGVGDDLFLACGTETATLVGPSPEAPFAVEFQAPGRALGLASGPGDALSATVLLTGDGELRAAILVRTAPN